MAQISDAAGIPTVQPDTTAPDITRRIQTSPTEFGAAIGQGMEKLGEGASQAGQFWGQIQTDHNIYDANGSATDIVEKFKGLKGQDALDAQADTEKSLQDAYATRRAQLSSASQQYQFDQQTRSFYQRFLQPQVYTHANQQATEYAKSTNEGGYKQAQDTLAALDPSDPNYEVKADQIKSMGLKAAVKNAHLQFGNNASDEDVSNFVQPYMQKLLKTQAETMAVKDPSRAADFIDRPDVRNLIGVDYPVLSSQFRARATEQNGLGIANDAFKTTAQSITNAGPQAAKPALTQAILQQESGDRGPNPGQITPATWQRFETQGLVRSGETYDDPAAARAVAARAIEKYTDQYGDPQRVAVAWFSGPGNVAPAGSAQPYIQDRSDRNGKTVSSYVQDITHLLGSQGPVLAARAGVYDAVLSATEGNPQLRQVALREVSQRYSAAEISDLADQKARKAASDTTLRNYGDIIRSGTGETPWRRDSSLTEEQVEHLDTLQRTTLNEQINGRSGEYGPGYSDVQTRILNPSLPNRIVNEEQLLPLAASGQITNVGWEAASKALKHAHEPGAEADRVLQANFYKSAQRAVTLESELVPGLKRPDGDKKWDAALPVLNQALTDGRAAGLTNAELMDPNNKKSVWTALKPFLPSEAEKNQATLLNDIGADHAQATAAFDASKITSYADLKKAHIGGKVSMAQAAEIVRAHPEWGVKFRPPPVAPPQVPTQ